MNRIHKTPEDAGVKPSSVATDFMGASGREMMRALIAGQADPEALAELAKGKLRAMFPALCKALTYRFRDHHAFLLERMLTHVEASRPTSPPSPNASRPPLPPFGAEVELLCTIGGVGQRTARWSWPRSART